jgi:hypothetical protein
LVTFGDVDFQIDCSGEADTKSWSKVQRKSIHGFEFAKLTAK